MRAGTSRSNGTEPCSRAPALERYLLVDKPQSAINCAPETFSGYTDIMTTEAGRYAIRPVTESGEW